MLFNRVSPTTIPDDVPTKTPANTEDSDMQSGTQSPSRSHEDVNEIFEALSENVHNALMEVHAICCDGVQDALEQVAHVLPLHVFIIIHASIRSCLPCASSRSPSWIRCQLRCFKTAPF